MTPSKLGRDFWLGHVATLGKTNQPLAAYAREHAIAPDTLRYWKAKAEAAAKRRDPFVPVRVQTTRSSPPLAATSFVIAVSDRVDPSWVAALTRSIGANA